MSEESPSYDRLQIFRQKMNCDARSRWQSLPGFFMKPKLKLIDGSIIAPRGFRASGVFCDIKRLGTGKGSNKGAKRDLALIVSEAPAIVAEIGRAHV